MQETHPVAHPSAVASALTGVVRTNTSTGDIERYDGTAWEAVNAFDAVKLAASRSFGLSGDVTGSTTSDWSANLSIAATVAADSHRHVRPAFIISGGNKSIASGGWSGMDVDTVHWDPYGCRSGQSAILKVAGWWYVSASVWWQDMTTGQALMAIWGIDSGHNFEVRGASDGAGRWARSSGGIGYSDGSRSTQTVVYQTSGGARIINEWTHFGLWLCP